MGFFLKIKIWHMLCDRLKMQWVVTNQLTITDIDYIYLLFYLYNKEDSGGLIWC